MSTGYTWTCTMDKSGIVREVSHDYKAEPGIGRGGTFRFVFEGLKAGTVKLSFNYARPWETGKAPAETKVYILSVDTEGKITT
jgi:predicted secreted protein